MSNELPVDELVLKAISRKGLQQARIRHPYKKDGDVCTPDSKDPALKITRLANGLVWTCHRCKESGFVQFGKLSPADTSKRIATAVDRERRHKAAVEKVTLPYDFIYMREKKHENVDWDAYHWLYRYEITEEDMKRWNIGWSPSYRRVIIPVYHYAFFGETQCKKLVGWVGREVKYSSKVERRKAGITKYLTKSTKGQRNYFTCPSKNDSQYVILVEDCLSAIKVWNALDGKATVIALLTTTIDDNLLRWLRGKKVFVWLDADARDESVKMVARMQTLGLAAFHMHTVRDPKEYGLLYIEDLWNQRVLTVAHEEGHTKT